MYPHWIRQITLLAFYEISLSEIKNKNKLLSLVNNYIGLNIQSEIESMSGIRATFLWTLEKLGHL